MPSRLAASSMSTSSAFGLSSGEAGTISRAIAMQRSSSRSPSNRGNSSGGKLRAAIIAFSSSALITASSRGAFGMAVAVAFGLRD